MKSKKFFSASLILVLLAQLIAPHSNVYAGSSTILEHPEIYGAGYSIENFEDTKLSDNAVNTGTYSNVSFSNNFSSTFQLETYESNDGTVGNGNYSLKVNVSSQANFKFFVNLSACNKASKDKNQLVFYINLPAGNVADSSASSVDGKFGIKLGFATTAYNDTNAIFTLNERAITYYFKDGSRLEKTESGVYPYKNTGEISEEGFEGYVGVSIEDIDLEITPYLVVTAQRQSYDGFLKNNAAYFDDFRLCSPESFSPYNNFIGFEDVDSSWDPHSSFTNSYTQVQKYYGANASLNTQALAEGNHSLQLNLSSQGGFELCFLMTAKGATTPIFGSGYNGISFYIDIPETTVANFKPISLQLAKSSSGEGTLNLNTVITYWFEDGTVLVKYGDKGILPYDKNGQLTNKGFRGYVSVYFGDAQLSIYRFLRVVSPDWNGGLKNKTVILDDIRPYKFAEHTGNLCEGERLFISEKEINISQGEMGESFFALPASEGQLVEVELEESALGLAALRSAFLEKGVSEWHDVNGDNIRDSRDVVRFKKILSGDVPQTVKRKDYLFQNAYTYDATAKLWVRFGVIGNTNLFAPNEDIEYYFTVYGNTLDGETATVKIINSDLAVEKANEHILSFGGLNKVHIRDSFNISKNGVYTLNLEFTNQTIALDFRVGVVPNADLASEDFLFGVQPYVSNIYSSSSYRIPYQNADDSQDSIFATIDWLGCNLIREDGISWGSLQPTADDIYDLSPMDYYIQTADKYGINYMWILGGTASWAVMDKYKESQIANWRLPPDPDYWDARVSTIAEHYKNHSNLIYEVWNEADWEFFMGTEEEYIDLLSRTTSIIRNLDTDSVILPSALVSNWNIASNPESYAKDSSKYYSAYKLLYDSKMINALSLHDHNLFNSNSFSASKIKLNTRLRESGFDNNPDMYVTEAGIWSEDEQIQAQMLMSKILWYRANGYKSYVPYAFRETDFNKSNWSMFTSTLGPKKSAIAYANLVGLIGNSEYITSAQIADEYVFADVYYNKTKTVMPIYACSDVSAEFSVNSELPYKVYDIYGNELEKSEIYSASSSVIYIVFDDKVQVDAISFS